MKIIWKYLQNQFMISTRGNFKKALKLSNYTDAFLKKQMDDNPGDADYALLYNRYHPLHVALTNAYNRWKNSFGTRGGDTLNIDQLLLALIDKIDDWDVAVQVVYKKSTPEYKSIFPSGRYPFNSGSKDTKVMAVNTLGLALDAYPALVGVKTEVDDYYVILDGARDTQEGAKGGTRSFSKLLEVERKKAMTMLYGTLGFLMNKFMTNQSLVAPFFDLSLLRRRQQQIFTGTLAVGNTDEVFTRTLLPEEELRIQIKTNTQAAVYLGSIPGGTDSTPILLDGKSNLKYLVSLFGDLNFGLHRYLTIVNTGVVILEYEVETL